MKIKKITEKHIHRQHMKTIELKLPLKIYLLMSITGSNLAKIYTGYLGKSFSHIEKGMNGNIFRCTL